MRVALQNFRRRAPVPSRERAEACEVLQLARAEMRAQRAAITFDQNLEISRAWADFTTPKLCFRPGTDIVMTIALAAGLALVAALV